MRSFDSKYGYDGKGDKERMTAKIEEIKAAPAQGKTRLVIREKDKRLTHAVIDIDMKHAKDLKEKGIYNFEVYEKDDSKNPGFQRQKSAKFKAYTCQDLPEEYTPGSETTAKMNRFGGAASGQTKRTRF